MTSKRLLLVLGIAVAASMMLASCGPKATEAPVVATAAATEAPVVSTRTGGWLDEIVFTGIDTMPNAVAQLQADALDVYAYNGRDVPSFQVVKDDPNLSYAMVYGNFDRYLFNSFGEAEGTHEFADGRLNPFSFKKIREAVNYIVDRNYLVQEALGGLGKARVVDLLSAFPDYGLYADLIRPLESKYAYNLEKGAGIIAEEMTAAGATLVDGKWNYDGAPVVIVALIRVEDERQFLGNYLCDQLETPEVGLTCDRQIRTRTELAPIWQQTPAGDGLCSFYTGGNYYSSLVRDEGGGFLQTYSATVAGSTVEATHVTTPEEEAIYNALYNVTYTTMDERRELFKQALEVSLQNSSYVGAVEPASFTPYKANLVVASDLSSGIGGNKIWPFTIRWQDQEGGTVRSANSGILTGPVNPIAGNNWLMEFNVINATRDYAALPNPYTGLYVPQWLEKAELTVSPGTLTQTHSDWVTITEADARIPVPAEAWADWNAETQTFITVGEKYPDGTDAKVMGTVTYRADMFDKLTWHDGSPFSVADFVLTMIETFDPCMEASPIYDDTAVTNCSVQWPFFKGVTIDSTSPLVITSYYDNMGLDADINLGQSDNAAYTQTFTWFPATYTGMIAWHNFAPAFKGEAAGEIAFTAEKSSALNNTWTNFWAGPTLEVMKRFLDEAQTENFIPYAPTLGNFVTAEEATARYANLQAWYAEHGHFWLGIGPYYIDQVNPVELSVVAKRYEPYPELADKWSIFGKPPLSVVDLTGPAEVTKGEEATFDAYVTLDDAPYATADIQTVSWLLYDATGAVSATGAGTAVEDGHWQVVLTADQTNALGAGSAKLELITVSKLVVIPTFATVEFVVSE